MGVGGAGWRSEGHPETVGIHHEHDLCPLFPYHHDLDHDLQDHLLFYPVPGWGFGCHQELTWRERVQAALPTPLLAAI